MVTVGWQLFTLIHIDRERAACEDLKIKLYRCKVRQRARNGMLR